MPRRTTGAADVSTAAITGTEVVVPHQVIGAVEKLVVGNVLFQINALVYTLVLGSESLQDSQARAGPG